VSLWSLEFALGIFAIGAGVILVAGTRLSALADELADRTGIGEALMGAVFLGAVTSLPGITASGVAAWEGAGSLALANAFGGVAAQTAFLALADFTHRRANLEHAAASAQNILMAAAQVLLLALLLIPIARPDLRIGHVHPATPVLFLAYLGLMTLVYKAKDRPMWMPRVTPETREDVPEEAHTRSPTPLWQRWALLAGTAAVVLVAGWAVAHAGRSIAAETGISQSVVGALGVAVVTSLPELVTTIAAVRRGALTLAAGGVLGGNAFATLFAGVADLAYLEGPVYAAAQPGEIVMLSAAILMAAVLVAGLVYRQRQGPAGIGFESWAILGIYLASLTLVTLG